VSRGWGSLKVLALLPLEDAPGTPDSGDPVTDALHRALESHGAEVVEVDATRREGRTATPPRLLPDAALASLARAASADAMMAGRVVEFSVSDRSRPAAVVERRGIYVAVPEENGFETRVVLSVRVVEAKTGRLLLSTTARLGPTRELAPGEALARLAEALVARWAETTSP